MTRERKEKTTGTGIKIKTGKLPPKRRQEEEAGERSLQRRGQAALREELELLEAVDPGFATLDQPWLGLPNNFFLEVII